MIRNILRACPAGRKGTLGVNQNEAIKFIG
jgi:hypothetical protein